MFFILHNTQTGILQVVRWMSLSFYFSIDFPPSSAPRLPTGELTSLFLLLLFDCFTLMFKITKNIHSNIIKSRITLVFPGRVN